MNIHIPLVLLLICRLTSLAWASACVHRIIPPSRSSGYINSPGYPNSHSSSQCIIWFIYNRSSHLHITIRILDLYLPTLDSDGHCSGDSLSFGPSQRRTYCGRVKDDTYEAEQNEFFFMMFNSSSTGPKGKGFVLHYSFTTGVYPAFSSSKTPQIHDETTEVSQGSLPSNSSQRSHNQCSFMSNKDRGQIRLHTSQLNSMSGNLQCTWLLMPKIFPHNGYSVYVLKFTSLHLYPGCLLYIYGGSDEYGQFYKEFSSEARAPQTIDVIGESTFLKLTVPSSLLSQGSVGNFTVDYERQVECKSGYKACGYNESLCYYFEKRCDGVWDCPKSGGDEQGCSSSVSDKCEAHKFSCMDKSGYCYTSADKCDGKVTCINYRDELDCSPDVCSSSKGLFLCKNRRCIYEKWTCDGTDDCSDGSDEDNCSSWESPRIIMAAVVGSVLCSLFLVIAMSFACRVYALHNHRHRGEHGRETPLSRYEAELLRQRPPPPSYPEAMLTSRPYEEAYLELLNDGGNSQHDNDGPPRYEQDPPHHSTLSSDPSREQENSGRRRRQRRRRRHRNAQQLARPSGSVLSTANQQCQLLLHRAGLAPPPYSLIHSSAEPEHSSSDLEDNGGDREEEGRLIFVFSRLICCCFVLFFLNLRVEEFCCLFFSTGK